MIKLHSQIEITKHTTYNDADIPELSNFQKLKIVTNKINWEEKS